MKIGEIQTTVSLFAPANWRHTDRAIIAISDVDQPRKSVYGFPMSAARLAAGQEMVLYCREDEILDCLAKLNSLLSHPDNLNQAYQWLKKFELEVSQKLADLTQPAELTLSGLIETVEQLLARVSEPTPADHVQDIVAPEYATQEIDGLKNMLAQLDNLVAALEKVKTQGFQVLVQDRQRQPYRPALESRRNKPILLDGKPSGLRAGFLLPARYHLTLWAYLVVRSDKGQSAVWN